MNWKPNCLIAGIDPGRSKCGLVIADREGGWIEQAAILEPDAALAWLGHWRGEGLASLVIGNGTGSRGWLHAIAPFGLETHLVDEYGTTLAARHRFWQLFPPKGLRRLVPRGLRLPPRDLDDLAAQLLVEGHLKRELKRRDSALLRTWPAP
ncbi:resolvase [Cyanobium sp. WAJ14-Wanaka]|uniref:resolvase n=1 Tax=Cyanobium sp. WAJ14-Wanaka TaxID=2823725 RepID=UPI0020CDE390|nr:resolvase [Cyanobium sp. WAJ14-Wanaka]